MRGLFNCAEGRSDGGSGSGMNCTGEQLNKLRVGIAPLTLTRQAHRNCRGISVRAGEYRSGFIPLV